MERRRKQIKLSPIASKTIANASESLKSTLRDSILELSHNPLSGKPLKGRLRGLYRVRIGRYRIVYRFSEDTLEIVNVGDRKEIYR